MPQNEKKVCVGLRQFGCIFRNIKQVGCDRCFWFPFHVLWGVINHISNFIDHRQLYFTRQGIFDGFPEVLVDITPCDGYFSIFPFSASMSAKTLETMLESTCNIFRSSTCQSLMHCLPLPIIFVSLVDHFSRIFESFSIIAVMPLGFCLYPSWILYTFIFYRGYLDRLNPCSRLC